MIIRQAEMKDVQEMLDIYNYEVMNGTATLDLREKTYEEWEVWMLEHFTCNYKILAAEIDNQVAGYATLSSYREKEAYSSTVELSVYVSRDFRKQGVASALMEEIIRLAREDESIHMIVSVITSGNKASEALHDKFDFVHAGTLHQVGYKHGKYQDIDNYELIL